MRELPMSAAGFPVVHLSGQQERGDGRVATHAAARASIRDRYLDFMDDWHTGERHLAYTLIAVSTILVLGGLIVPFTLKANEPLPQSKRMLLAQRYVEAVGKVKGLKEPVPTVAQAAKTFGVSGGKSCSEAIPKLHASAIVRPKGRASFVDPVAVQHMRVVMRVYCPARDARYATWLKARTKA